MNYYVLVGFNLTIWIAGVIGMVRFRRIHPVYYPFLYCLWLGGINELLAAYLMSHHITTLAINNVYALAEALLLLWFFYRWGASKTNRPLFFALCGLLIVEWALESLVVHPLTQTSLYFRLLYSLMLVLFSIQGIQFLLNRHQKNLLRSADFLLCFSLALFFTYKIIVFSLLLYGLHASRSFLIHLYLILIYINLGTNLIYAIAVLWMPKKIAFTYPLS